MSSTTDTLAEMADVTIRVLAETCCDQYRWMTIAAGIFGFLMAFGIGANDVANAFATSVSAKSISLKQGHRCGLRVPWGYASRCICDINYS